MMVYFLQVEHLQRLISDYQNRWTKSIEVWQWIKASAKEFMTLDFAQSIIYTQLIRKFREQPAKKTVSKQTHVKHHDLGNQDISFPTLTLSVGGLYEYDVAPI